MVHLICISKLRELLEKVIALLFLNLKLAILDVEVKNPPDIFRCELWDEITHSVFGDVWDITVLTPEQLKGFADLGFGISESLSTVMLSSVSQRLNDVVEDPVSLDLDLLVHRTKSVTDLDLEPLWDVFLNNFKILWSTEEVVYILSNKLVFELLTRVQLSYLVLVNGGRLSSFFEDLFFDLPFAIQIFALHHGNTVMNLLLLVV